MRLHRSLRTRQIRVSPYQTTSRPGRRPLIDRGFDRLLKHTHIWPHLRSFLNFDYLLAILYLFLRVSLSLVHLLSDLSGPLLFVFLWFHKPEGVFLVDRVTKPQKPALKPFIVFDLFVEFRLDLLDLLHFGGKNGLFLIRQDWGFCPFSEFQSDLTCYELWDLWNFLGWVGLLNLLLDKFASKLLVVHQNLFSDFDPTVLPASKELGGFLFFELILLSVKLGKTHSLLVHVVLVVLGFLGANWPLHLFLRVPQVHEIFGICAFEDCGLRVEFDRVSFLVHFNYGRINQGGVLRAEDRPPRERHIDKHSQESRDETGLLTIDDSGNRRIIHCKR